MIKVERSFAAGRLITIRPDEIEKGPIQPPTKAGWVGD